jgi:arylsulfatase A-like enzyme
VDDGYDDDAVELLDGHRPAGPLRGGKYSIFEGGTRIPFIVRWPARVKPAVSDALICQIDFLASFAALTGQSLAKDDAPDSLNILPALLGESSVGRTDLVEHANTLALRQGTEKYIEPAPGPRRLADTGAETGQSSQGQFYQLADDLGETNNIAKQAAEKIQASQTRLEELRRDGRSRQ